MHADVMKPLKCQNTQLLEMYKFVDLILSVCPLLQLCCIVSSRVVCRHITNVYVWGRYFFIQCSSFPCWVLLRPLLVLNMFLVTNYPFYNAGSVAIIHYPIIMISYPVQLFNYITKPDTTTYAISLTTYLWQDRHIVNTWEDCSLCTNPLLSVMCT